MANVIHPTTLVYLVSVNTPDYGSPWVVNPDMSQVAGVATKYWKWDVGTSRPVEMTTGEKAVVDAAEAAARAAAIIAGFDASAPPGVFRSVIKPSTTTRTATTTLADDPHLKFPVVAGGKYIFQFRVFFDTTAAGDFKIALNGPASPTGIRFRRFAIAPGGTTLIAIGVSTAYGGGVAVAGTGATGGYCEGYGILSNGANAGDVAFSWAQNTSDAGNSSVLEGSMLWYARIG